MTLPKGTTHEALCDYIHFGYCQYILDPHLADERWLIPS
jgi:hypothetical protein